MSQELRRWKKPKKHFRHLSPVLLKTNHSIQASGFADQAQKWLSSSFNREPTSTVGFKWVASFDSWRISKLSAPQILQQQVAVEGAWSLVQWGRGESTGASFSSNESFIEFLIFCPCPNWRSLCHGLGKTCEHSQMETQVDVPEEEMISVHFWEVKVLQAFLCWGPLIVDYNYKKYDWTIIYATWCQHVPVTYSGPGHGGTLARHFWGVCADHQKIRKDQRSLRPSITLTKLTRALCMQFRFHVSGQLSFIKCFYFVFKPKMGARCNGSESRSSIINFKVRVCLSHMEGWLFHSRCLKGS